MSLKSIPIATPNKWKMLETHPLAKLVDFGIGMDMPGLIEHMKKHGYDKQEPIMLIRQERVLMILDGRHRHVAALEAGVVPTFRLWQGDNPVDCVIKKNLRQHVPVEQRAKLALALSTGFAGQNETTPSQDRVGVPLTNKGMPSPEGMPITPLTNGEAAKITNISEATLERRRKIERKGCQALRHAVDDGVITILNGAALCDLPVPQQIAAIREARKAAPREERPKRRKEGLVLFDLKDWENHFGHVVRGVTELAKAYDCPNSERAKDIRDGLNAVLKSFRALHSDLTMAERNSR